MNATLLALALLTGVDGPSPAEGPARHVALVIGNAAYAPGLALNSPTFDADAVQSVLENDLRFDRVIRLRDASREEMVKGLRQLRAEATDAVVFVYYSGHAVQLDGENYLLPVDATSLEQIVDVRVSTLPLGHVLSMLTRARLRVIVLDACRTNPLSLGGKGDGRAGLAPFPLDGLSGTLVAYASAPGTVAYDGPPGRMSPYTEILLRHLTDPALSLTEVFIDTRRELLERTRAGDRGPQLSQEVSSLVRRHHLHRDRLAALERTGSKGAIPKAAAPATEPEEPADVVAPAEATPPKSLWPTGTAAGTVVAAAGMTVAAGALAAVSFSPVVAYYDALGRMTDAAGRRDVAAYDRAFADGEVAQAQWDVAQPFFWVATAAAAVAGLALATSVAWLVTAVAFYVAEPSLPGEDGAGSLAGHADRLGDDHGVEHDP